LKQIEVNELREEEILDHSLTKEDAIKEFFKFNDTEIDPADRNSTEML
jgi:hypothetical protein